MKNLNKNEIELVITILAMFLKNNNATYETFQAVEKIIQKLSEN